MTDKKPLVSTLAGRRYMVINEIISTETKYINDLNTILSIFLPAFEHVVAPRNLRLLIPAQLEMLVESHQEILTRLKQRVDNGSKFYGIVGDIFARLCDQNVRHVLKKKKKFAVAKGTVTLFIAVHVTLFGSEAPCGMHVMGACYVYVACTESPSA